MTDINELVQRKNAAISQLTVAFEPGHISPREVDALSLAVDVMNELVEALEKAHAENELNRGQLFIAQRTLLNQQRTIAELQSQTVTAAAAAVLAERQRQVTVEGWTPKHDDEYSCGEMALAASAYALYAHREPIAPAFPFHWPREPKWFKQQGARRDLVKAGALILAEIERIDRAAGIESEAE